MDVGATLREAREQRAISLDEVARVTKIKVATLRAIEANQRDGLPEEVYVRGFVRAYAHEVGLDPADTAKRYVDQFASDIGTQGPVTSKPVEIELKQIAAGHHRTDFEDRSAAPIQWVVVAILCIASTMGFRAHSRTRPVPLVAQTPASPVTATQETATAGARESATPPATESGVLNLDIRFDGPCWLSLTADGARVVYRMMQAGEQYTLDVHHEAVLRVGDPSALTLSINGIAARSLGPSGEAVTAQITGDNYRDFLSR